MKFSIIMPSYLGSYRTAAKDRDQKIHRAIKSVLMQSYTDFELYIVADGCEKTFQVALQYGDDPRVKCSVIPKQKIMSGNVRNFGIDKAQGEWIAYLDIDDYFGTDHLKIINSQLGDHPWIWFNDYGWDKRAREFKERPVDITRRFKHGTSNIAHKKILNVLWKNTGYEHDFHFVNDLKKFPGGAAVRTPQYFVCHLPGEFDV